MAVPVLTAITATNNIVGFRIITNYINVPNQDQNIYPIFHVGWTCLITPCNIGGYFILFVKLGYL